MMGKYFGRNRVIYINILFMVCVFIFGYYAFSTNGPSVTYFFTSIAFLFLWTGFNLADGTSTDKESYVSRSLSIFLIMYGFFCILFPSFGASKVLPSNWQWPIAGKIQAVVLKSGQKAVVLENLPRVQIYDANSQYLSGWFVPIKRNFARGKSHELIGISEEIPGHEGQEIIVVEVYKDSNDVFFTPEGQIVSIKYFDKGIGYRDRVKTGHFETISFKSSWYDLPYSNPSYALFCGMAGFLFLGWGILSSSRTLDNPDNSRKTDKD